MEKIRVIFSHRSETGANFSFLSLFFKCKLQINNETAGKTAVAKAALSFPYSMEI